MLDNLNISQKTKDYFNRLGLSDIIQSPILINDESTDINEATENCWSFRLDLEHCAKEEIKAFFQAIIKSRKQYLLDNHIKSKMIFYTWYDCMSGNFYFSIIPKDWIKLSPGKILPFESKINHVKSLEEIIEEFVNDTYKGAIPLKEFKFFDVLEELDSLNSRKNEHLLKVWSTVLEGPIHEEFY